MTTTETPKVSTLGEGSPAPRARTFIVDTDVHPRYSAQTILPLLDEPWKTRLYEFGFRCPGPQPYPRIRNSGGRLDARGSEGGLEQLAMTQEQLIDLYDEDFIVLIPLASHTWGAEQAAYSAELCHAMNEWQVETWLDRDPRVRGTLNVPFEHPDLAVKEIERYAGDKRFVSILMGGKGDAQLGDRKYWPMYAAGAEAGLSFGAHVGGFHNHHGTGWPSYYIEMHVGTHSTFPSMAVSMISEGLFDAVPDLQVAFIEGCITWSGPLQWSMDAAFERCRAEFPTLAKKPSEYFREHFWFSTQPMEEPEDPEQLVQALEMTGMTDRIMFSSDYPHWDFDSPTRALPSAIPQELRDKIMGLNACRLYGLTPPEPAVGA